MNWRARRADLDPRDAAGLADVDAPVGPDRQAERAVEPFGKNLEGRRPGAPGSCERELEQPAAAGFPAAHVDKPESPRRNLEHAAREEQAARAIGEQRDAPA